MKHRFEIGNQIVLLDRYHKADGFREITRVTETMAFAKVVRGNNAYELKFNREISPDGVFAEKGDTSWNKNFYRLAKDGDAEIVREKTLRFKVSKIDWSRVPVEKIEQIFNLIES